MASYESFYGGADSVFSSSYGNLTGYSLNASMLGFPGSPQSANQVQDVVNAVKHGTKVFEVTMLQPDVSETIPKQHFEEIRALMKLTGVKPSVHAPVIDSVGFGEQGWGKEEGRADNERRMFDALEKAQGIDPTGKLPVVFHATNGTPGCVWRPGSKAKGEPDRVLESGAIINQETGQVQGAKREEKWRTRAFREGSKEYGKPDVFKVESSVDSMNSNDWDNKLIEVMQMNKHAEEIIGSAPMNLAEYKRAAFDGEGRIRKINEDGALGEELPKISGAQVDAYNQMRRADLFLENVRTSFEGAFGRAYEYGSEKQREDLKKLADSYSKSFESLPDQLIWSPYEKKKLFDEAVKGLRSITSDRGIEKGGKVVRDENYGAPKVYKLSEDLALEKASETFGNLAARSYGKFGDKAPVLAIENAYPTQALSGADSMKKLVEESRRKFVSYLIENEGLDKKKAEKLAEDKIGVTWDIGHLNMVRGKGFGEEEIIRQTKLITGTDKPDSDKTMVKHLHLTDNFGYADTHLIPGMGNVPVKEILEELEKTGRFDEIRKITEAGGIVQHFRKLPHGMSLAAMGSPIYGMTGQGAWNQAIEMQGSYFGGYGDLNPGVHHSYFGAGFTTMPTELGGQMAGGQSRFGGTPMA